MLVGKAKICNIMFLITSILLLSVGIYGTILNQQYNCDNALCIKSSKNDNPMQTLSNNMDDFKKCMNNSNGFSTLDSCLNKYSGGTLFCMDGSFFVTSISAIVIGSLMLLLSIYFMFGK